ncbi:MAG: DeoR/GlpR transcriptional regulator [Firmicutes bacterium]|nr:DeoR/GlpR transcriptional regulator [Bacillota bacterium]
MDNRRHKIVELINLHGELSFTTLKEHFPEVSEVTLRKDLRYLDSEQLIVRIHGGAKSLSLAIGAVDNFYTRSTRHTDEKTLIAQKAISLLRPNQSLFIGSGSSCTELCKNLPDIPLQVFTDGLMTALELSKQSSVEATILGGEVNTNDVRASGPRVFNELNQLHFDLAFLGTDGYRINQGFGCYSPHSAALFNALRRCSDKLVVLMDHSKVNAARAARNIPADYANYVVSDNNLDSTVTKSLTQAGVTVL